MKTFLVICFLTLSGFTSKPVFSQDTEIIIKSDQIVDVEEVFDLLKEQTTHTFIYSVDLFDGMPNVSLEKGKTTVGELLKSTVSKLGYAVEYEKDGTILVFGSGVIPDNDIVKQEQLTVSGTVTDPNGMPILGVNVIEKGTANGVVTNFDGEFSIEVPPDAVLVFSYLGFATIEIEVDGEPQIDVSMEPETSALEEVVVVGYGTQKKINLSGSISHVRDEYFESRPVTNAGEALQGAIGNLNITRSSGQPGKSPDFNIRGFQSISGGSPLIIVDGVPSTAENLNQLNPNEIASVSVLKDVASAAIYGSRAAFGVILITTKNAISDEIQVNVNSNFSAKRVTNLPRIVTDPYQVAKFRDIMGKPWYDLFSDDALNYAQQVSDNPNLPRVRLSDTDASLWQYFAETNWFDEVYKDLAFTQVYNANISQRTKKGSYYLAAETLSQEGMLKYNNDIYKRHNLRAKLVFEINDWLTIGNNSWFNNNKYDEPTANSYLFFHNVNRQPSLMPLYNPDGSYTSGYANTIGALESGSSIEEERSFFTKFNAEIELWEDKWKLNADASFRRTNTNNDTYQIPIEYKEGPDRTLVTRNDSYVSFSSTNNSQDNYNIFTTYKDTFDEKHDLNIVVGYNQEEYYYDYKYTEKTGLISSELPTVELATGTTNTQQQKYSWAIQGLFYRFNYIFNNKYIIEANGRYDGSSRFPNGDRWAFNPSVSGAWIISEEGFFSQNSFINLLKVRASYGSLGNQNLSSAYPYIPSLNSGLTTSLLEGEQVIAVTSPGLVSPSLTWETVTMLNFGVNISFFGNKLSVGFDWYRRYTEDMLTLGEDLPSVLGTSEPLENAADLVTKGWEFKLIWKDQFMLWDENFNYGVRLNIADNHTTIEKFDNPSGSLSSYYIGQEIGEIWGLKTLGFFQTNEEVASSPDQTTVASYPSARPVEAGDVKFADLNGDGVIDNGNGTLENPGDYRIIGNSTPRYTFGVDIYANWKGFDFRVFFQGVGKRDWYPVAGTHYFWGIYAQPWASLTPKNLDHWTPENPNAFFPRPKSYSAEITKELGIPQTRYLQDASYIRMKNLTIGYTIPDSVLGANAIRIYLSGENLFDITQLYEYLDPEILGSTTAYPFQKTYSLGVSLNF